MEDSTSIGNDLEVHQVGEIQALWRVVVEEPSKSSSCYNIEERDEQMGDHLVVNKEDRNINVMKEA